VKTVINQYSLDGVNVDFEGLNTADRGTVINSFMTELTAYIHTQLPGKEVSYAGPAVNWGGWDLPGLAAACDYIFIMGYDFSGSWSTTTAPTAPLIGGYYNITNTVTSQYGACPPNKIILGVPYYGVKWKADTDQPGSTIVSYIGHPFYAAAIDESQSYSLQWHSESQTVYYVVPSSGKWNQIWFDDTRSTGLKYNLATTNNLKGVGMWALGYDGAKTELWGEINKYLNPSGVDDKGNVAVNSEFSIKAYPNPLASTSKLLINLANGGYVSIKIYDVIGRLVRSEVLGERVAGTVEIPFSANGISSGVYFLSAELISNGKAERKMLKLIIE
jgi:GH18 family chitinase